MSGIYHIAVLMTCHNRVKKTIACLDGLMAQQLNNNEIEFKIYLVDDGSTDGTGEEVRKRFPEVIILPGDGSLYWCGGMRLAFGAALKEKFDYYLWLNDDAMLFQNAVSSMIKTSIDCRKNMGKECIIVGSMHDSQTKQITYGGSIKYSFWNPLSFKMIEPDSTPKECDVFNGNCVLIPNTVANAVGNLNASFTHGLGDYEYGIQTHRKGFLNMIAPGYVGTCSRNIPTPYLDDTLSIKEKLDRLSNLKFAPPADEYMKFIRINGGFFWPVYWLRVFVRKISPLVWLFLRSKIFKPTSNRKTESI